MDEACHVRRDGMEKIDVSVPPGPAEDEGFHLYLLQYSITT